MNGSVDKRRDEAHQPLSNGYLTQPSKNEEDEERATGWQGLFVTQSKTLVLFALAVGILLFFMSQPVPTPFRHSKDESSNITLQRPRNLHVLIPASRPDQNLCKVLLSSAILGYPAPVIINWNQSFDDGSLVEGGSHLAKISGVNEYVLSLDSSHDEDLVLMIDGYDIWMQLRPQTVIDRYFDMNRRADERILSELGTAAEKHHVRQEIIFGCQKRCWPWTPNDPPCYAVPNSSLPYDIYGPQTDTPSDNEENPYINYRQRFLNSGMGIGTVKAMRKLFGQALELAKIESNIGSDQYIFSHIYGDQEIWREALRRDSLPALANKEGPKDFFNPTHIEEVRAKAAKRPDKNFEFGIGVDHGSEIVLNTVFAEDDTEWLFFNDTVAIQEAERARNIPSTQSRLGTLAQDIVNSLPPFWTFSIEDLPRWTRWQEVPLFTDIYTGIVPAVIHHNAHRNGMKSLRETWWPLVWFQKYARTLFDAHIYSPVQPVATGGYDNKTTRQYWPYEIWRGGARNGLAKLGSFDDGWIKFDDVCREHGEEIFRDGKGPWMLPDNH